MARDTHPLSDLSFFRFPELTGEVVRDIALLLVLLALTVLVTVALQNRVQRWLNRRAGRSHLGRFFQEHRLDARARALFQRLMALAGARDEFAFVLDAEAYEHAAAQMAERGDEAELAELALLRRALHLNVMNAERPLVSTRQLLAELPVRLVAHIGPELLDLYCALLSVDERHLLIALPEQDEVSRLLAAHPDVFLIYWREREGEAVFRIRLEPYAGEGTPLFGAAHAFRDPGAQQRDDFRLTLDVPATCQLVARPGAGRRAPGAAAPPPAGPGEGRLLDLSYGGASLRVGEAPEPHALLQLGFDLHGRPLRLLLEVLSVTPEPEGRHLLRGRFRGLGEEARARLHASLYREQLRRLRDKALLHVRQDG
jgi:hypothetical protein